MKLNPFHWIVIVLALVLFIGASYYNSFVSKTNAIEGQWKQVEVQYQRRVDLIPNLVESVKGLQKQEQKIFSDVEKSRQAYTQAQSPDQKVAAANQLEGSLGRLIAIFENYPQIKSDQAVLSLMDELSGTENRIAVERRRYNELVQSYNTSISVLPASIFARVLGFTPKQYFNASPGSQNAPKVSF